MDPQRVLESLAREKDVPLTSLSDVSSRSSQSGKVACCGGLMTRLVTESAADSTVLLRDGTGSCYCALHGDITNRYPDVLTTGALLLFTDITVLVLSSKLPPLLVACLQNLSGLLLPDEASTAAATAAVMDTVDSMAVPPAGALDSVVCDTQYSHPTDLKEMTADGSAPMAPVQSSSAARRGVNTPYSLLGDVADEKLMTATDYHRPPIELPVHGDSRKPTADASSLAPARKRACAEEVTRASSIADDDDDDAECLELVDDDV
jgi:hypothetical protein